MEADETPIYILGDCGPLRPKCGIYLDAYFLGTDEIMECTPKQILEYVTDVEFSALL